MTTTCLRSFKFQLHPKNFITRIGSSQLCLPRTHACYQYENADTRNQTLFEQANFSETRLQVQSSSMLPAKSLMVLRSLHRLAPLDLHCYDPLIHAVHMKRLTENTDAIYLGDNSRTEISRLGCDENWNGQVIQGEDLPMTVLMDSLPAVLSSQIADARQHCVPLTEYERSMILSSNLKPSAPSAGPPSSGDPTAKPTDEQLQRIFMKLGEMIPEFFVKPQDYNIFHSNLIFQNNIRGVTTHGLPAYIQQMALLRLVGHLKFAFVKMEVLKVTKHSEDGTVRIRWRIRGISGLRVLFVFWKYKLWNFKDIMQKQTDWYDGFSTFYVGGDGLVHKHVCDKMMPDDHKEKVTSTSNIAAKLALMLGAIPQPSVEDLDAICMALEQTPK